MCKQWTNCLTFSPCPEDCGEVDIPKDIITGPFNNNEGNRSLKISIGYILGNDRLGGADYLPLFWLLNRVLKLLTFNQWNSIQPKVYTAIPSIKA